MSDYDFKTLSSHDFEDCIRDLLQQDLNIRLESFKSGRDQGIDLRYSKNTGGNLIVQCKHYAESGFSILLRDLKNIELPKVQKLKPARYLMATSVGLSPGRKDKIKKLFSPYCIATADIYGKEDLNNLLRTYPSVERKNFKLWLSSSDVLSRIVHNKIFNYSETEVERIRGKIKVYVQNDSFFRAIEILDDINYCIIAGIPGIGKTTLAEILLLHHLGLGYEPIKITNDISEAYAVLNQSPKQLFYYDDFLGQTSLEDKMNKNEDESLLRFLATIQKSKTAKLILTTREYILAQAKATYEKLSASSFDYKKCVVALEDYTKFHRAKTLYNHVYFSMLQPEYASALLHQRQYMKIINHQNFNPRIIDWMTQVVDSKGIRPENYVATFISSLKNPAILWKHAFENQLTSAARHILLVMTSLPAEVLLEDLERSFASFYEYRSKSNRFAIEPKDFRHALKELESNFVHINKDHNSLFIKFHNPSIKDFLVNYIKENDHFAHQLVDSAIYFEQIFRLWNTFFVADISLARIRKNREMQKCLEEAVVRLFRSDDCRLKDVFYLSGEVNQTILTRREIDTVPLEARARCALDIAHELGLSKLIDWVFTTLVEQFSVDIHERELDFLLKRISRHEISPPKYFLDSVKEFLCRKLDSLDDLDRLLTYTSVLPQALAESERVSLRNEFESTYEQMVENLCEQESSAETLREYADRLKELGEKFGLDVDREYDLMQERASDIEAERESDEPSDYDGWKESAREVDRTEDEIHSMFDSLR